MEEDEEDFKYEIFPWALGTNWRDLYPEMLSQKTEFWMRMNFRAAVSRKCCEEVMRIRPEHFIWKRRRNNCHGGAIRNYHKTPEEKEPFPRGPGRSPIPCRFCVRLNNSSGYLTDENISGDDCYLQVSRSDSSPDDYFNAKTNTNNVKRRNGYSPRDRAVVNDVTNTYYHSKEKRCLEEDDDIDSQSSFDMNKLRATLL